LGKPLSSRVIVAYGEWNEEMLILRVCGGLEFETDRLVVVMYVECQNLRGFMFPSRSKKGMGFPVSRSY
jgi:hypothetical protein